MPIYRGLVTIKRAGRYHPPGSLHDFSEDEAKALGPSRVTLAEDQTAAVELVAVTESAGSEIVSDAPSVVTVPPALSEADGASHRVADIAAAFDLLDEKKDFWKSGARTGKPKQKPIEEIVGFGISDADIDAALALREAVQ